MKEQNKYEKDCIRVYMSFHVSELRELSPELQIMWKSGQILYHINKPKSTAPEWEPEADR